MGSVSFIDGHIDEVNSTLEYMQKQLEKHKKNHKAQLERNAPQQDIDNIKNKIGYYSEVCELLKRKTIDIEDERPTNITVKYLKEVLNECPDDMLVVMPVIEEEDNNHIIAFRFIRTAGILRDDYASEDEKRVLCINTSAYGADIYSQVEKSGREVTCEKVLY